MAWQVAFDVAKRVYRLSENFPRGELFGLRAQMRRAAVSVASNVAEGAGRSTRREFSQFVTIALGSLNELETQYLLAVDLGFAVNNEMLGSDLERLYALLNGLRNSLNAKR